MIWKHVASNALTLFIVIMFLLSGVAMIARSSYSDPGPLAEAMCLRVEPGSNMRNVAEQLAKDAAITSKPIFLMGVDFSEKADDLKAGAFLIKPNASMVQIVDTLTGTGQSTCGTEIVYQIGVRGNTVRVRELDPASNRFEVIARYTPGEEETPDAFAAAMDKADTRFRVVVVEGVTSWQVVEGLNDIQILEGSVEERPAEGGLAPDSYEVKTGQDRAELIALMQERQKAILTQAWAARADDLPLETIEEALVLASIVEKETAQPDERRTVASVFINRLRRNMKLQTDPTVIYGITRGEGVLGRGLRQSELRGETPWNTYVISGLPPTPIANPGRAAIEAALNPDGQPYIFFVADGTGGHAFAETLDEHNANVAKWRKIDAERAASGDNN